MNADRTVQFVRRAAIHLVGAGLLAGIFHLAGEGLSGVTFGLALYLVLAIGWAHWSAHRSGKRSMGRLDLLFVVGGCLFVLTTTGSRWWEDRSDTTDSPVELTDPSWIDLEGLASGTPMESALSGWMQEQIRTDAYPSLDIAVSGPGGLRFSHTAGDQGVGGPALYPVASVTKAFTGVLLLRLHQEGLVELDTPIGRYLPEGVRVTRNAEGEAITLLMLATHTSGLPRSIPGEMNAQEGSYESFQPERLYKALSESKLEFTPGTDRSYSNFGFGLLGELLGRAAGTPYMDLVRSRLLVPAGMRDTAFLDYNDPSVRDRLAVPRRGGVGGSIYPPARLKKRLAASGGLASTAADLARFGSSLLRTPSPLLDAEHVAMLSQSSILLGEDGSPGESAHSSPFGRVRSWDGPGTVVYKNGGRRGAHAHLLLSFEQEVAIAVAANRDFDPYEGSPDDIAERLLRWLAPQVAPSNREGSD